METLSFDIADHIATISFKRPERMNSFNKLMGEELYKVTKQVSEDSSIRAVLLNGHGKLFMAGGDIQFFYESLDKMPAGVSEIVESLNASIINLMQMPKPVLASVHGSVAGAGMSLMMACDLVIAAEDTKMTMAYSGIGISPDGGATFNLPRLVGTKKAMELIMLSEVFDARMAEHWGLINWAVPADELAELTQKLLKKLSLGPTQSYLNTKRLINEAFQKDLASHLKIEGKAFERCTTTEDFKIGVTSFLTKTRPKFTGT